MTRTHGAGLHVVHHHNRNRDAKGSDRLSGAGSAEWGRYLITASERARNDIAGGTEVVRDFQIVGTSLRDRTFTVTRRITAEDESDPDSELTYWVEVSETADTSDGMSPARRSIYAVANGSAFPLTLQELNDRIVTWGHWPKGLSQSTLDRESKALLASGKLCRDEGSMPFRYWRTDVPDDFLASPPKEDNPG